MYYRIVYDRSEHLYGALCTSLGLKTRFLDLSQSRGHTAQSGSELKAVIRTTT